MADYKPSDLFLGVFEVFGILIPGAALVFFVDYSLNPGVREPWLLSFDYKSYGWGFLVAAYFAGQLMRSAESLFECAYKQYEKLTAEHNSCAPSYLRPL